MAPDPVRIGAGDALLIVDLQRDFLPGGALPVPRGDEVVPVINRYIGRFTDAGLPVLASRDWHPPDHCSFSEQGGPWPVHCVAGSEGAQWAGGLELPEETLVVSKATRPEEEAYSAFQGTDLAQRLRQMGTRRLFIGGLATDYCVLNTVLDALREGFDVLLLSDAIRAVDVNPGDGDKAIARMLEAGARPLTLEGLA